MPDARTELLGKITEFFKNGLLEPEQAAELTPETSLRQWGALNSLKMARLIGWIREDLGVEIPMRKLTGANFRTLNDITDLVLEERMGSSVA
ncbi:acyl carrier protein [Nucisporomicrobium flavum]|uniref:acyl carrier protein n=1 Tax=Nucisporomicrobium flavum TaxID=2785915 RepID=UPI0018F6F8A1|nr:acyl carrier protein [Nucisporomicrobium flavum]